ncbi:MAG: L-histidine N(alpha)-methyltransferase [Gemmatimonadaceae bacterium]
MCESIAVPTLELADARTRMMSDVRDGLVREGQKELPPTYFYDARGSQLFDQITRLDEYYPTRAERVLLERCAPGIVQATTPRALAELGAGTATKSRVLLRAMTQHGPTQYLPLDVDGDTLELTAAALRTEFPSLEVLPIIADMRDDVAAHGARHPLLYAFLGSTIGNFDPDDAHDLLSRIRATLRPTDRLLLGVDLVKDVAVLHAAYNDALGVTAEFNLNVLRVLNRELHADFDLTGFRHRAFYDVAEARIEMHLVACRAQHVHIPLVGDIDFADGESVRTEISCKYDRTSATALLERAGFRLTDWLTEPQPLVALALAEPAA